MRCIDDALGLTLTTNGRILRNLIHGADTVMSHILHFYHLAAADYVDASALGSPWNAGASGPAFGTVSTSGSSPLIPITTVTLSGTAVIRNYVEALNIRRQAHTMSAIFSGRHPIQNAIVPGGVTTIFTQSDINDFRTNLKQIRNFIDKTYIPDVVTVATLTGKNSPYFEAAAVNEGLTPVPNYAVYWTVGTNPGYALSYGEYPTANTTFKSLTNSLLTIPRGIVKYNGATVPTLGTFFTASIGEYVLYSKYNNAHNNLHPSAGETDTDITKTVAGLTEDGGKAYTWLKAPRINTSADGKSSPRAHEVGPLARMVAARLYGGTQPTVPDSGASYTTLLSALGWTLNGTNYNATNLVSNALLSVATGLGPWAAGLPTGANLATILFSPLGRHACRALEAKFVADAMYLWLDSLSLNNPTSATDTATLGISTKLTGSGYTYVALSKATVQGTGLCEAPRGALGHWITIQNKKITRYQPVVPSTWNASPKASGTADRGAAESALNGIPVGTNTNDAVLNIARMLHPYDFCIACAVHVVGPEGKEIAKFTMEPDGKVTRLPVDSE